MTIESYFERRICPEDNNGNNTLKKLNSTSTNTSTSTSTNTNTNRINSIIDEDQLARTFQEIVNCINLDDDSEDENYRNKNKKVIGNDQNSTLSPSPSSSHSSSSLNFSRSNFNTSRSHHSLLPEFDLIFGGTTTSFNIAVGDNKTTTNCPRERENENERDNREGMISMSSGKGLSLGRSFLDDDWSPPQNQDIFNGTNNKDKAKAYENDKEHKEKEKENIHNQSHTQSQAQENSLSLNNNQAHYSGNTSRPVTPAPSFSSSRSEYITNIILKNNQSRLNSYNNNPPLEYICKLCNFDGHWMKDCRLYESRTSGSSSLSFKSSSTGNSIISNLSNSSLSSGVGNQYPRTSLPFNQQHQNLNTQTQTQTRTLLPPGNYVCRLCNVPGHWIDQCSKFQPKLHDSPHEFENENVYDNNQRINGQGHGSHFAYSPTNNNNNNLPPMLGPGPTPNYRPPAYLSKPVPSNYLCNLCNLPGHWIQQCTEFTPIINKPPGKY